MKAALAVTLFFPLLLAAQQPPDPAPLPASKLVLRIQEHVPNEEMRPCSDVSPDCTADVFSTIEIFPDLSRLPIADLPSSAIDPVARAQREDLNRALEELNRSLVQSRQILEAMGAGASEAELDRLSAAYNATVRAMGDALVAAARRTAGNENLSRPQIFVREYPDVEDETEYAAAIAAKIKALDDAATARLNASLAAAGYTLRMGAVRQRKNADAVPVHLPGYDTFTSGAVADIRRITFNVSAAEADQNARDVQATAAIVKEIRSNFQGIMSVLNARAAEVRTKLDDAERSLADLRARSSDISAALDTAATGLGNLNNVPAAQQAPINALRTDLTTLRTIVADTLTAVEATRKAVENARAAFDTAGAGIDADRPDLVLGRFLSVGSALQNQVGTSVTTLTTNISKLRTTLADAQTHLTAAGAAFSAVSATARETEVKDLLGRVTSDLLTPLVAPLMQLDMTKKLVEALQSGAQTANAAQAVLNLDAPQILSVTRPIPTRVQIRRVDPQEDDVIDIGVEVFRGQTLIYEERRSVQVKYYGWKSGLASGLVAVRANRPALQNGQPEAAAIWRVRYLPRPDSTGFFGRLRPGLGFHTTTLHFVNETGTQFGAGVSAHLWDDILQFGYGWNMGVQKDRGYSYIGLGLLNVLRKRLGD